MALQDVFLAPVGLVALLAVVPLVVLYLIRPDPRELALPTARFLDDDPEAGGSNPVVERLVRNLLFLVQLLVLLLLAVSLASPYVTVQQHRSADATVLVLDASASMATRAGGQTRLAAARTDAAAEATKRTSVVVTGATTRTLRENVSASAARNAVETIRATGAPGDLRTAVSQAASMAGPDGRVVVYSDFVDESGWRSAVTAARARGTTVRLRQFDRGGSDNVGFVARTVESDRVTLTVANTGTSRAQRQVRFAGHSESVTLRPGDVAAVSFRLPAGGGTATLSPGDAFPVDDSVPVGAPKTETVDVLLVTNDENRNLVTALSVIDTVSLTVARPPAAVSADHDVVVFSNVDPDRVLDGTLANARDVVASGGGVAILAQPDLRAVGYGRLLPIRPRGLTTDGAVATVERTPLTAGFEFSTPEAHVAGNRTRGRSLVAFDDGTPLLSTAGYRSGRLLYYGYVENRSKFRYDYRYPVFWKRAIYYLADRPATDELNRRTGERLAFANETRVDTPSGTVRTTGLTLARTGFYETTDRRIGVALLRAAESNVTAPSIDRVADVESGPAEATTAPRDLTPLVVAVVLVLVVAELAYLRYRGDL
ncbi:MAG: BatA domain-containing protein [Haloarculaceae archaeon]